MDMLANHTPMDLIEMTCCPAVSHDDLQVGVGDNVVVPRFLKWECVFKDEHDRGKFGEGCCDDCGIRNLFNCRVLQDRSAEDSEMYECMVWEKSQITRSVASKYVITHREFTLCELLERFESQLQRGKTLCHVQVE